jgi:NADP-dependent 3-hydroxy acid dehydrogenase YdfG
MMKTIMITGATSGAGRAAGVLLTGLALGFFLAGNRK